MPFKSTKQKALYITFHLSTIPVWHNMAAWMMSLFSIMHLQRRDGLKLLALTTLPRPPRRQTQTKRAGHYSSMWRIRMILRSLPLLNMVCVPILMSLVGEPYVPREGTWCKCPVQAILKPGLQWDISWTLHQRCILSMICYMLKSFLPCVSD